MQMPSLLPENLQGYATFETEEALFSSLIDNPQDFIIFFDYACDDETWSNRYSVFIQKALSWLTKQSFQSKLSFDFAAQAAKSIRSHYENLRSYLPRDLIFKLDDTSIEVNSLLYCSLSPFFRDFIVREGFGKKNFKLEFHGVSYQDTFRYVEEFANSGSVYDLWKLELDDLLRILNYSSNTQLKNLSQLCEEVLARYLNVQNVYTMLLMAHKKELYVLSQAAFEFINSQMWGISLESRGVNTIGCRFLNFSEKSLDVFNHISSAVTHLIFSDDVPRNSQFANVVKSCPALISLDLSHTNDYSEYYSAIPESLQEINLSACEWLTPSYLRRFVSRCPRLKKISLGSNVQLSAHAWGELLRLRSLGALDLTRCQQIRDEDFKIVLHACSGIVDLSLEDCKSINEGAFSDIARGCGHLQKLNLSRTNISDAALVEIVSRCQGLRELNLTRCERLTEKSLLEIARHGLNLQELNLTNCTIANKTIDLIRKERPLLTIIHGS